MDTATDLASGDTVTNDCEKNLESVTEVKNMEHCVDVEIASNDSSNQFSKEVDIKTIEGQQKVDPEILYLPNEEQITTTTINENELKLKDRIENCRETIERLKQELNEEKSKLELESRQVYEVLPSHTSISSSVYDQISKESNATNFYGTSVASKLGFDDNFTDYENKLQHYQTTLAMAQLEKKNSIRREMMTKAYRLKLLEVENQCNIELLRVKQSLQCLEPLQMIANQWKCPSNNDAHLYEFPCLDLGYPQLNAKSFTDLNDSQDKSHYEADKHEIQSSSSLSSSNR